MRSIRTRTAQMALALIVMGLAACGDGDPPAPVAGDPQPPPAPAIAPRGYAVTLATPTVSAGPDQQVWLRIGLTREAGFTDAVTVTLDQPPAGISADAVVFTEGLANAVMVLRMDATVPVGRELALQVLAASGATRHTASGRVSVVAALPLAQAGIAAALDAGRIDYGTSLLYRAYALLGDRRLPEALRGAGSAEEDNELFDEIALRSAGLPADMQAQLRSFTLRPDHAQSVWQTPAVGAAASPGRARVMAAGTAAQPGPTCSGQAGLSWISQRSASHPVRVWAQCRAQPANDADSERNLQRTLTVIEHVYLPMTALMGAPLPDVEGIDDAVDIYILDNREYVYRDADYYKPSGLGSTFPAAPARARADGASAFVTLPRDLLGMPSRFHNTVIHEFFHVLQKAHNAKYAYRPNAARANGYERHWFIEASATWASAHFDRKLGPWPNVPDGRGAYADVYRRYPDIFQPSLEALNATTANGHDYSAFIWPYFVEQQTGSTQFMKQIWDRLSNVTSFEAADDAISAAYAFDTNFKKFALRNLNTLFMPGDALPESKRHVQLDKDQFRRADLKAPPYLAATLVADQEVNQPIELNNLSARYLRITLADGNAVRKVTLESSALGPAATLDMQAMVRTDDGWLAEPIDIPKGKAVFCFDEGQTTASVRGSFREMVLILANHDARAGNKVSGAFTLQPKSTPCTPVWAGDVVRTNVFRDAVGTYTTNISASVVFEYDDQADQRAGEVVYRLRSGTYRYDELIDQPVRNPACRTTRTSSGTLPAVMYRPGVLGTGSGNLSVYPDAFEYRGSGLGIVMLTETSNCNDRNVDVVTRYPFDLVWWNTETAGTLSQDRKTLTRTQDTTRTIDGVTQTLRATDRMVKQAD